MSIKVKAEREYEVKFVSNFQAELESAIEDREAVLITPESLKQYLGNFPQDWHLITVPEGEAQKSADVYVQLLNELSDLSLGRGAVIVGIGGGATTDLAGFLAATYLRGVEWIAVPTSLAGMVDASIGGKTGINLDAGKNLAGAFYSPSLVLIDQTFLSSLGEKDLRAGLAEVVKCGFISDSIILDLIERGWRENLPELIRRSVQVKADVVSNDFKESFNREILNYGHTLGHAIEKHSKYTLRHGECVSIGMVFAAEISASYSGLPSKVVERHYEILKSLQLPTKYDKTAWPDLYELMQSDKKKKGNSLRFVTLTDLANPTRLENVAQEALQNIYLEKIGE